MLNHDGSGPHIKLTKCITLPAAWAFSFGCTVGWGAFIMPGTTFLPVSGPLGIILGLFFGTAIMMLIGVNYSQLMKRHADAGGSYSFTKKILGGDHGFLCGWILILTYIAIAWANTTALSLIVRCLFGDLFCFGFSYRFASYTVYAGEVLLSLALTAILTLIFLAGKKIAMWLQTFAGVILFLGITACFIAIVIHCGGFSGLSPLLRSDESPSSQFLEIIILTPWAFIGFESIAHSTGEFKFSRKKITPVLIISLLCSFLSYVMLALCAAMVHPDGYAGWGDYIKALASLDGVQGIPTFYSAQQALGNTGLVLLGCSAFCAVITCIIGYYHALSRLMMSMSSDGMLPKPLSRQKKDGTPWVAVLVIAAVSIFIPLFGRTAIGWIVDITTVGTVIVYAYVSICAFVTGKREGKRSTAVFGICGAVISLAFAFFYIMPFIRAKNALATESYLILIVWSVLGILVFRILLQRDHTRRFGKSEIVWVILFVLVIIVSTSWIDRSTNANVAETTEEVKAAQTQLIMRNPEKPGVEELEEANEIVAEHIEDFGNKVTRNIFVQDGLILCALIIIFSIFAVIKKREKVLEAERLRAERESSAKTSFLFNMSHDIRTPMNAVTGYTALALKEGSLPDNIREYLEKIDYSGKQLLSLINDILDMSRIESGKVELSVAPDDLCQTIDEVIGVFALQMQTKNIECTATYEHITDKYVLCDKSRVTRILLNLVSNAYKFTPEGGKINIKLRQNGKGAKMGHYVFTVSDTGIGMSPEFVERIFEPFERERTQTVIRLHGTGLGMTITKSLVELMGGAISVESEKDKGTTFTITLSFPHAKAEDIKAIEKTDDIAERDFSGIRLLLAEDNPINSEIACEILKGSGFIVDTAENGKEAVEKLTKAEPGTYLAVLMDIQMPVMNGYEAAAAIRALDGEVSQIPIIALTANTFESDRRDAFNAGMNAHVSKPFVPEELVSAIASFID